MAQAQTVAVVKRYTLIKQSAVLLGKLKHKDSLIKETKVAIPLFVIKEKAR